MNTIKFEKDSIRKIVGIIRSVFKTTCALKKIREEMKFFLKSLRIFKSVSNAFYRFN